MLILKKRYPWKIGATSFVLPAVIGENVAFLGDRVDDVQLLFFESPGRAGLENEVNTEVLRALAGRHEIGYTVHLPTDIRPGDSCPRQRRSGVEVICALMETLASLAPRCFDLHVPLQDGLPREQWLENVEDFFSLLKRETGELSRLVAVENLNYPFSLIRNLAVDYDFSLCLDVGHALVAGEDLSSLLADLSTTCHIHYHGVRDRRDHQALHPAQQSVTEQLGKVLQSGGFTGVVTLEVYRENDFENSLSHLAASWISHERRQQVGVKSGLSRST